MTSDPHVESRPRAAALDWAAIRTLQARLFQGQNSALFDYEDASIRSIAERLRVRVRDRDPSSKLSTDMIREGDVLVVGGKRFDDPQDRGQLLDLVGDRGQLLGCGMPKTHDWQDDLGGKIAGVLTEPSTTSWNEAVWRSAFDVVLRRQAPTVTASVGPAAARIRVTCEAQRELALTRVGDALAEARVHRRRQLAFLDALDGLLQHALTAHGARRPRPGMEVRVSVASNEHGIGVSVAELSTRRVAKQVLNSVRIGLGQRLGTVGSGELELGAAIRSSSYVAIALTAGVATELVCYLSNGRASSLPPSIVFVNLSFGQTPSSA